MNTQITSVQQFLTDYKEVVVSMINKMLDALYEENGNETTDGTKKYEELRRKVLDDVELNDYDLMFLALIVTHHCNRLLELSRIYAQTADTLADMLELINERLKASDQKLDSKIIDFPEKM